MSCIIVWVCACFRRRVTGNCFAALVLAALAVDSISSTAARASPEPPLTLASDGSTGYFIRFPASPGSIHRLQRAASVAGPWTDLARLTAPDSGLVEYHEAAPLVPQAFYRVVPLNFAPPLTVVPHPAGGYLITYQANPGERYDLQRAADATGPWSMLARLTAPANGLVTYHDTAVAAAPPLYRLLPPEVGPRLEITPDGAGGFLLTFQAAAGNYRIQRASRITGPWETIALATAFLPGLVAFDDTEPPPGQSFYRTLNP